MNVILSKHARERIVERLPGVDPDEFADGVLWAIAHGRTDVLRYVRRYVRPTEIARIFEFEVRNETWRIVLTEQRAGLLIKTVHQV